MATDRADHGPGEPAPEIPGYRIDGVVGHGATGIVYRATQLAFGRRVALKVLHPELIGRGRPIRRLQREARLGARLTHPNLVSSIDMGETDGRWWHAMELIQGPSLAIVIHKEERLKERHALRLFIPLADAVGHLCEAGVVHRDIKPQNILVDPAGRPRLVDLGLAFAEGDPAMTRPGGTLGTPFYVSPEQARDPTSADVRSDLWSLGATMYHALCGRPPFEGESIAEILSGVLYSSVDDPREVNPELTKGMTLVLRKCLTREPARRYQSVDELLDDLERLRERRGVKVRSASLDPVSSAGERRRRLVGWAASIVAVITIGLLLWTRPWISDEGDQAPVAEAGWAPADQWVTRAVADPSAAGGALRALEELAATVPSEHSEALERSRGRLLEQIARAVSERRSTLTVLIERAEFRQQGFAEALDAIDRFAPKMRAELGLDSRQLDRALAGLDLVAARRKVEGALKEAVDRQRERIAEHYDRTVGPAIESSVREGRWVTARDRLVLEPKAWITRQFQFPGFPPEAVDELVRDLNQLVFQRSADRLVADWRALDRQLAGLVATDEAAIDGELAEASFSGGPVAELERRFGERLRALGLERAEMLDDVSHVALDALEQGRARLVRHAADLVERDAEAFLAEREAEAQGLRAAREYGRLREFWAAQAELDFMEPKRDRIALYEREAGLLEDLLQRAAAGVEEARNREVEFFHKSLLVRGRLTLVGDPLEDGFHLEFGASGGSRFRLRPARNTGAVGEVLGIDAIEQFAGLPREPSEPHDPELRLARALLRLEAGDAVLASELLDGLPAAPADALVSDLSARIHRSLDLDEAERSKELAEAKRIVRAARKVAEGERHAQDVETALAELGHLFRDLAYLDWVQARKDELRALERELVQAGQPVLADVFQETFAPTELTLEPAEARARLTFEFGRAGGRSNERVGAWRRPPFWSHEGVYGWRARERATLEGLTDEVLWPRLLLRPPLDVASNDELEVSFRLRQLSDSGSPELLLLSVAGWHVALVGPGHSAHASGSRWYATTGAPGSLSELLADVEARRGRPFPGLAAGRTYEVRVALTGARGRLELEVFEVEDQRPGEELQRLFKGSTQRPAPELDEPGTQSIVVRSLEPVRLERVVVEGDYVL